MKSYLSRSPSKMDLLLRVKLVQIEMVRDRGYDIPDFEKYLISLPEQEQLEVFNKKYQDLSTSNGFSVRNNLSFTYTKGSENLLVYYIDDTTGAKKMNVDVEVLQKYIEFITKFKLYNSILIHKSEFTSPAYGKFDTIPSGFHYQIFNDNELYFNITTHFMAMKHIILTRQEKDEFLKTCDRKSMPLISENDAMVKYYGGKEGQIVKIIRRQVFPGNSPMEETAVYKLIRG